MERIQKIIASAGLASRRGAEDLILRGEVTVNGKVAELGAKADPLKDHIKVRGKLIHSPSQDQPKRYFLLNKPKGFVSTTSDPQQRPSVLHLLPQPERSGLHLVGRLDFNSEGLMILTDDGDLTNLLTRPGKVPKTYMVKVHGAPSDEDITRLRQGMSLGKERTAPAIIRRTSTTRQGGNCWYEVVLSEGKNQQIRRMFDSIGHPVAKLRRTRIGHLSEEKLEPGQFRKLKPSEVLRFSTPQPVNIKPPVRKKGAKRSPKKAAKPGK
ncbi:MAG: pseudouridine synthase [Blastocatellia bacterium]